MASIREMIDLLEDAPETGMLSAQALATMLPDIENVQMFASGLLKIEQGQQDSLFITEIKELAHAFSSLVKLPREQKMLVIEKMMPVQQRMVNNSQSDQSGNPSNSGASGSQPLAIAKAR